MSKRRPLLQRWVPDTVDCPDETTNRWPMSPKYRARRSLVDTSYRGMSRRSIHPLSHALDSCRFYHIRGCFRSRGCIVESRDVPIENI